MSHKATIQEQFEAAVHVIQSLPKDGPAKPSHETMLTFYALFKQAKNGPCNVSQPGFWDVVGRAKWNAWKKLGNMPKESAMQLYVNELKKTIENTPQENGDVSAFIGTLGNFYELLGDEPDDNNKSSESDVSSSHSPSRSKVIRDSLRVASRITSDSSSLTNSSINQDDSCSHILSNGGPHFAHSVPRMSTIEHNRDELIESEDDLSNEDFFDSITHFSSPRLPSPINDLSNLSSIHATVKQMEADVNTISARLSAVEQSILRRHRGSQNSIVCFFTSRWSLITFAIAWPVILQIVVTLYRRYKRSRR